MKKILIFPILFLSACSGGLPESEVQKIFSRHSYEEHSPERIAEALKEGPAGLARLDSRAAVLAAKRPLKARPADKNYSSGLLLVEHKGALRLAEVFAGSPAAEAGLKTGDEVVAINGEAAAPAGVIGAIGRSTAFNITVRRRGAAGPLETAVSRDRFFFPQVFSFYDGASRVCFLRLGLFHEGAAAAALKSLRAAAAMGAVAVVIDLRDNPGGVPEEAASLLKAFAPSPGPVFLVKSRHPGYSLSFEAQSRGRLAGLRAAVLVNGGTAMAAEVFAQAMKDLAGAAVIGGRTAAGVSMARAFALGDGRGLEITVARLFPPSGRDLESSGVEPDIKAAGEPHVWDNSREATLLGDEAYLKALDALSAPLDKSTKGP